MEALRFGLHRELRGPAFPADAWEEILFLRLVADSGHGLQFEAHDAVAKGVRDTWKAVKSLSHVARAFS